MNGSVASVAASEVGPDPMGAYLRAPDAVSEIEHRVDRARQLVARQRELVARVGERLPDAATLLKTFETTLALFEKAQATLQRSQTLRAEAEQVVHSDETVSAALAPNCPEPGDAIRAKSDYEKQMSAVARIMKILREGGYRCELERETLH
jgi:type II secretory pathway component PulM